MPVSKEIKDRRKAYLVAHPTCEYWLACGRDWAGPKGTHRRPLASVEVHHVLGRGGPGDAAEWPGNWLAVSRPWHDWATDNSAHARIVALWFKWKKRDPKTWNDDLTRMRAVFGQRPMGWLANQLTKELPVWVRTRAEEVLA